MIKVGNRKGKYHCMFESCMCAVEEDACTKFEKVMASVTMLTDNPKDIICPCFEPKKSGGKLMSKFNKLWDTRHKVMPYYKKEFDRLLLYTARRLYNKEVFDPRVLSLIERG